MIGQRVSVRRRSTGTAALSRTTSFRASGRIALQHQPGDGGDVGDRAVSRWAGTEDGAQRRRRADQGARRRSRTRPRVEQRGATASSICRRRRRRGHTRGRSPRPGSSSPTSATTAGTRCGGSTRQPVSERGSGRAAVGRRQPRRRHGHDPPPADDRRRLGCRRPTEDEPGARTIALDATMVTALRAWRRQQHEERLAVGAGWRGDGWVFCWQTGDPIWPQRVSEWFRQHCRRSAYRKSACTDCGTPRRRGWSPTERTRSNASVIRTSASRWGSTATSNRGHDQSAADALDATP